MSKTVPGRAAALAAVALALLVLAPAAAALPKPAVYFLHDQAFPAGVPATPIVTGIPLLPGELVTLSPPGLPPLNTSDPASLPSTAMQTKAPQSRAILPGQDLALPVMFNSNASANTGRIYGPVITLLFLPKSPTVQHGNVTVQLVVVPKGAAVTDLQPKGEVIASTTFSMDAGNTTSFLPNATALVPPNPQDPAAALGYVQGQLLAYGITTLASSYKVAFLLNESKSFIIDKQVDEGSTVQLRLSLTAGSSPAPVATAAGQPLVYWNFLTPSFVYVPWYATDPAGQVPTYTKVPTGGSHTTGPSHVGGDSGTASSSPTKKKSPGVEVPVVVLGLAALVLVARRRLR
ncbi:MAG TPA: hypothetical protein VM241_06435 [Candidatus Thermoplasmatota archaeon]|nr:hypothetical protein [Candidatus Thermoplasmatota archaeon]